MLQLIRNFFFPRVTILRYDQQEEIVVHLIKKILNRDYSIMDPNDMHGDFTSYDEFEISLSGIRIHARQILQTRLIGRIISRQEGFTEVHLKEKPSWGYYITFFVSIICGFMNFAEYIRTDITPLILLSLSLILLVPLAIIGLTRVRLAAIRERYDLYIHEKLV